jgi:hypothetical protein
MPLSEDEQRILRQIEEQLQRDHTFARDLRPGRPVVKRRLAGWVIGTVAFFVGAVLGMTLHPLLGFALFVGAVATALMVEAHVRDLAEHRVAGLGETARARVRGARPTPRERAD